MKMKCDRNMWNNVIYEIEAENVFKEFYKLKSYLTAVITKKIQNITII